MTKYKALQVESPIGRQETDSAGAPVGVVRMDAEKSYAKHRTSSPRIHQ